MVADSGGMAISSNPPFSLYSSPASVYPFLSLLNTVLIIPDLVVPISQTVRFLYISWSLLLIRIKNCYDRSNLPYAMKL